MTKIVKLVLNGFKSFANRTELIFGDNFNVVLGPNGSGKSNILDAICFVLGRMSSKELRAEKLSNLIYNGGKSKKPAAKAEVAIFFDNTDKAFPVEDKQVKISRVVNQKGQSVYRINDAKRTRQQVLDTLSAARIDPDGYNIILQGDIIHFVEMSSDERRKIIEEISGISVYEDKKQKALNELEKVEDRLKEAEILLTERKVHLKELKDDRDQALQYRELNNKVRQNRATNLSIQIKKREEQKKGIQKNVDEFNKQIAAYRAETVRLRREAEARREEVRRLSQEIEEKSEREQVRMQKEIEQLRVELGTNSNRVTAVDSEIIKIDSRREQLAKELLELDTKIAELNARRQELEKGRTKREQDLAEVDRGIERFKKTNKLESVPEIEVEIERIDKDGEEKQAALQSLAEKKQILVREKDKLDFQVQSIDARVSKVLQIEKDNQQELDSLKAVKQEFKKLILDINASLNEDSSLAAQLQTARKRMASAGEELARLQAKQAGAQERMSSNLAVKKILEQRTSIRGIYGTISQLGTVKGSYSTALEVAAGNRVENIVVENDEVAASCIKYLKTNRLGTATFLPLNKLRQRGASEDLKKLLTANGVHGLAIDLITFDRKFLAAFEYVFGTTVVVDNIDVAKRLGIGSCRMVTLDGDLTEISGAMHGGFRQKAQSSSFNESGLSSELTKLEKEMADLSSVVSSLETKRQENEERLTRLKQLKAEKEGDIIKTEKGLHLDSEDLDVSKRQKQELKASMQKLDSELASLETNFIALSKQLSDVKMSKQKLREKIGELRNPVLLAELNAFDQTKANIKEEILKIGNELKNSDVQINTLFAQEKERLKVIIKQIEKEQQEFKKEKEDLKKLTEEQRTGLKQMEKQLEQFYAQNKELFSRRAKLAEEAQKLDESAIMQDNQVHIIEVKMNNTSLKNAELLAGLAALQQEFEQFTDVMLIAGVSEEATRLEIERLEQQVREMGNVNLKALEVYEAVEQQYNELMGKREKLIIEKQDVLLMMNEIETKKRELFMNSFNIINNNFQSAFKTLLPKAEASLIMEDPNNPFEAGVRIRVKITGTRFLDIRGLSGGEKTMTALAFIFAIQENEPASFYVFDEVDAALDKHNSETLSNLIARYSSRAQYVVISHNDAVISEAANLYGVAMDEHGISKVISLKV